MLFTLVDETGDIPSDGTIAIPADLLLEMLEMLEIVLPWISIPWSGPPAPPPRVAIPATLSNPPIPVALISLSTLPVMVTP